MTLRSKAITLLNSEGRFALVTLQQVRGSSPREEGAQMLVASSGFAGSIGGGTLEWQAMAEAQKLLIAASARNFSTTTRTYSLGPDLGQCCGGRVTVETRLITTQKELDLHLAPTPAPRQVLLYGAGHVGRSLVLVLAQAPFAVTWIDNRPNAFPSAVPSNVSRFNADPLQPLTGVSDGALVVVMSHSHDLDFAVTDASLRTPAVARVLLIGSQTKRARFLSRLTSAGVNDAQRGRLICPIGDGTLSGKTPFAVALSTAHQLMALDEALSAAQRTDQQGRERQAG